MQLSTGKIIAENLNKNHDKSGSNTGLFLYPKAIFFPFPLTADLLNFQISDPRRAKKTVDDTIAAYNKRTDIGMIKSLEVRIANTQKEMDSTTTAYIQAVTSQNQLFIEGCDKRMKELAALLEDLEKQHLKLELEREDAPTRQGIYNFISEFIDGDVNDKAFQKRLIANLVNCVYVYNKRTVVYISFENNEYPFISKPETDAAIQEIEKEPKTYEGSGSMAIGGESGI